MKLLNYKDEEAILNSIENDYLKVLSHNNNKPLLNKEVSKLNKEINYLIENSFISEMGGNFLMGIQQKFKAIC